MKQTLHRLLSLALALAMVLSLLSVGAFAAEAEETLPEGEEAWYVPDEEATEPETPEPEEDLWEAEEPAAEPEEEPVAVAEQVEEESVSGEAMLSGTLTQDGITFYEWTSDTARTQHNDLNCNSSNCLPILSGSYYLVDDVTLSDTWNLDGLTINLHLNGHKIIQTTDWETIHVGQEYFSSLYNGEAVLNIYDNAANEGVITHTSDSYGVGVGIYKHGTFHMYGGCVTGNNVFIPPSNSGVIMVYNYYLAGGVGVQGGSFFLHGGSITGNFGSQGGGVLAMEGATFVMSGGSITGNRANSIGGGVLAMDNATFVMSGGSITGNRANSFGGGVFIDNSTFHLSGSPTIKDNLVERTQNNVVETTQDNVVVYFQSIDSISSIVLDGALTNTTPIGVSILRRMVDDGGTPYLESASGRFTSPGGAVTTKSYLSRFASENSDYLICAVGGSDAFQNELCLDNTPHNLTCSVSGNKITCKCTTEHGCTYRSGGTLTINKPASLTYNGSAKKATLTNGNKTLFPGSYTIVYYKGSTKLSAAPKDAGSYTAKVTAGGKTASVAFTIAKAAQSAPAAPVVTKITPKGVVVKAISGQEYSVDGGKTWQKSGSFAKLSAGKTYTVITRKAAKTNYNASKASAGTKVKTMSATMDLYSGLKMTSNGKKITVKWGTVPEATKYYVWVQDCGTTDFTRSATATAAAGTNSVTITKVAGKAVSPKKTYKAYVVAKKGSTVLGTTVDLHCAASGVTTYSDPKTVTLPKTALTLKKGKTASVGAKVTLVNTKAKCLPSSHDALLRYCSSNSAVASVDKKGKITAKGAGVCVIQAVALNGVTGSMIVTVTN